MATPFIGEIKIFSFNFPPKTWAFCNGQLLPINQNQALFSILGTTYGGNGQNNFALPDLRSRTPIHMGNGYIEGQVGGEEAHTLNLSEMPAHNHQVYASGNPGSTPNPSSAFWAGTAAPAYGPAANLTSMEPQAISNAGGNQPHSNLSPYLALNFCISLSGIFPSR